MQFFSGGDAPAQAPAGDLIKDATDASFPQDVIEASKEVPVLVDFWAPWCGPCKTLGPMIERAVQAAGGKIKLVKINVDENNAYAGQLGVRSIPAVFAFKDGRPVDGFMGALPEGQIKDFIDRMTGAADASEAQLEQAQAALDAGDVGGAAQLYAQILQTDPSNLKAAAGMAECFIAAGQVEQAQELLDQLPPEAQTAPELASVKAKLDLAANADPEALRAAAANARANPDDLQAQFDYGVALSGESRFDQAADIFLAIIGQDKDWNEGAAREQLLKVFDAAGPTSDVAKTGRRRLSTILFS